VERLTERIDGIVCSKERYEKHSPCHHCKRQGTDKCLEEKCTYGSVLNRLAEYEDMKEQGRLIKLPCKEGTKVYIKKPNGLIDEVYYNIAYHQYNRIFLTRDNAEQALKGVEDE